MPVIRYAMLCLLFYVNVNLYTFYVTVMLYTFMLCYVMLCYAYVMLYILYVPVMLCMLYVTFCSALFCVVHILCACYVICYVMLPYVHFMWLLCYTCYVLCYVTFYVMLCYYMLCACYVIHMLFYVMLCCIMLCYTHVPVTHRNWHLAMRGIGNPTGIWAEDASEPPQGRTSSRPTLQPWFKPGLSPFLYRELPIPNSAVGAELQAGGAEGRQPERGERSQQPWGELCNWPWVTPFPAGALPAPWILLNLPAAQQCCTAVLHVALGRATINEIKWEMFFCTYLGREGALEGSSRLGFATLVLPEVGNQGSESISLCFLRWECWDISPGQVK